MVTIHREGGLRIVIFKDDHEPAHIHVIGDGEAKISLLGPAGRPTLLWSIGFTRGDLRRVLRIAADRQDQFLARWRDIHG